jgi:predicted secreted hydrolase
LKAFCKAAALLALGFGLAAATAHAEDDWQRAVGPWSWNFPRDHGAHPDFKTEWWYFTGNLRDGAGRPFGYQLTLFRQGVQMHPAQIHSAWALRDFYFGHFTISDLAAGRFYFRERTSRGALGEAHAAIGRMDVQLGPWSVDSSGETYHLVAQEPGLGLDLQAVPQKPLVLEGVGGLSQKAPGTEQASYYYSYPRLGTSGRLTIAGKNFTVSGLSWFDHEFSTSSLAPGQTGWDWFCVQLDDREEIMLYLMRDKDGTMGAYSEGTWVRADGTAERLPPGSFTVAASGTWTSPADGARYPAGWHVRVPGHRADLTINPAMADQELRLSKMGALSYWEGACTISGTIAGAARTGVGYTELTGYAGSLQQGLGE